jgi:hypothetical protein
MQADIREDVVAAMVAWKRAKGKTDPNGHIWELVNSATMDELLEAMRRLRRGDA